MVFKCSECGGILRTIKTYDIHNIPHKKYICTNCGRERKFDEKVVETIDMSENANLKVIME